MDTSAGAGRDARFNLGYNSMSLLGGDTSPDMYGSGRSSATSLSSHSPSGMSRSGMGGLSGSCAPGGGGLSRGLKRSSSDVCFLDQDVTGRPLDCGSDLMDDGFSPAPQKSGPPPNGKKTKGRVKIKMEYIDNKLRRYTTFSKRKTGIMKKAYELSTLTGTQVMLLVASETGHVYTFATRKLQPMITSEAGKALIQTCLNSPDPCPSSGGSSGNGGSDQRMSATGFEETELSYNIGDDEQKESDDALPSPRSVDDGDLSGGESSGQESPRALSPEPQAPPAKFLTDVLRTGIRKALQQGGSGGVLESSNAPEAHQQTSTSTSSTLATSSSSIISTPYPAGVMIQTAQGLVYAPNNMSNMILLSPGLQFQSHNEANGSTATSSSQASSTGLRQAPFMRLQFPMTVSDPQVTIPPQSRNVMTEAADLSKGRK